MKRNILIAAMLLLGVSAQAQMIGSTNSQRVERQNDNYGFSRGSHLRFAAGYPILGSVAWVYKVNPNFSFGVGAGVDFPGETDEYWDEYMSDVGDIGGCIFAEIEVGLPFSQYNNWGLFVNAKFGLNILNQYSNIVYYDYYDYDNDTWRYRSHTMTSHPYTAILTVGASYGDFRFGVGMSTVWWFGGFFSYDIRL